jgi:SAM-dependent methyltransferase
MKESDIRPADLFQKYLDMSAADAEAFFGASERFDIPCPACESATTKPAFEKWGFHYVVCDNCKTLYQSPRPPQADFSRFYQDSPSSRYWAQTFFPTVAEARREKLFRPKVQEIANLCEKNHFSPHVIADIGAGYGLFLQEWRRSFPETQAIAVEPNPDMADICRSKNLEVLECFAEEAGDLYGKVDLVVGLEVIEHVHDPFSFVCSLWKLLQTEGRILLTGLTIDGFDIQVLWEHSKSIAPPHHINFMSVKGFETLLSRAGFKNIQVFTPGKLDVDIVRNTALEIPDILENQRFIRILLERRQETTEAFQKFLSENQLSSHCWMWAEK